MPGIDGMELVQALEGASTSLLPILIMTGHGDVPLAVEAMKVGAVDFLEKPFDDDRLTRHDRDRPEPPAPSRPRKSEADRAGYRRRGSRASARGSARCMEGLVAGLSNKMIARDYDISPRTIEVYRANVMTKMQAASLSELVRLAMRAGALKD